MSDVFDFFTKKKFCKETREDKDDLKKWEEIYKKFNEEAKKLTDHNVMAAFVVVGVEEFSAMKRIASKEAGRTIYPNTLNGIPIILVPANSYCEIVPKSDDLYRALCD